MSKTSSAVVCETNQILGKNQENVYFHSLFRLPEEFGSSYVRSAKSTAPIQICALFSAQGEDTLAAMTLQAVLAKMQEITAATQQMSVLDYENFTSQVVNVLNTTVCNESLKHNGANIRVSMSMVIIEGDTLRVMNIGNTHIWMFRQGKLISLTENQTVAHRYVQMGAIPKEAEYTHEGRNELTQYLGRFAQDGEVLPDKKVHLKLMDGDELVVPRFNHTVRISGDVYMPNTVAYEEGKGYKYYIEQAGGFGDRAKKKNTYVVYQNGTMAVASKAKIEPGCEVIVPTKAKKDGNQLTQWLGIGTSMASLATMFVSVANLLK